MAQLGLSRSQFNNTIILSLNIHETDDYILLFFILGFKLKYKKYMNLTRTPTRARMIRIFKLCCDWRHFSIVSFVLSSLTFLTETINSCDNTTDTLCKSLKLNKMLQNKFIIIQVTIINIDTTRIDGIWIVTHIRHASYGCRHVVPLAVTLAGEYGSPVKSVLAGTYAPTCWQSPICSD